MRKWMTAGLCAAAVVMLMPMTGCSGNKAASGTDAQTESGSSESSSQAGAEAETEEYVAKSSVKLGEYKGIPVTVTKAEVTDEELESQIAQMLSAKTEDIEVDRAAKNGDTVNIDYKGMLDGVAFDGGTAEKYDLVLGSHSFIDGFEEGLVGVKKGDKKSLNLTFPDPYQNADLAGKDVVFEVTVNSVKEKKVPVFDDAFAAKEYPEQGTAEKLRAALKDEMLAYKQYEADNQRDTEILKAVIEGSEIVCATEEVDKAYDMQLESITAQATNYGLDLATFAMISGMDEDGLKAQVRDMAKTYVQQELVLKEIAAKESITVTDEDREQLAKDSGFEDAAALVETYGQEDVDQTALYRKVMAFLVENADVTELDASEIPAAAGTAESESAAESKDAAESESAAESKGAAESESSSETKSAQQAAE